MEDEDFIAQLEAALEEDEAEIVELKSWSTRDKFEDKAPPVSTDSYSW